MKRKVRSKSSRSKSTAPDKAQDLLRAQRDLALVLSAAPALKKGLRLCLEAALRVSGMDCGGVYLCDQVSGGLDLVCHAGLSPDFVKVVSHYGKSTENVRLVAKGKPKYATYPDLRLPLRDPEQREGLRAFACIPLHHEGQAIGCLNVASRMLVKVPRFVRDALETVAAQIGSHIARLHAAEALRQSEEKHKRLIETTNTGYVILNEQGRVTDANQEYVRLTGHRSLNDIRGRCITEWTAKHDLVRNAAEVQRCLETGAVRNLEIDYVDSAGRITPVEINATVFKKGEAVAILSVCRDITERRKAQAAQSENEERYRTLAEAAHDMIFIIDRDDRVKYVNQFAARKIGRRADEIVGKPRSMFFPGERGKEQAASLRKVFETGVPLYVERPIDAPSREIWLGTWLAPICGQDGSVTAVLGISRDMTARKRAEVALRESEERFRTFVRQSRDGIIIIDSHGIIVEWNDGEEAITGIPRAEAMMQPIWEIQYRLAPDEIKNSEFIRVAKEKTLKGLREGTDLKRVLEDEIQRADGARRIVQSVIFFIPSDTGALAGAICRDITERKRAEEALRESEERFRRIIELSPMSMALVAMDGTIEYINRKAVETFGYLPGEVPTMDRWWVLAYPDENYRKEVIASWIGRVEAALAGNHEIDGDEYCVTCKDGSVKTVFIFGVPVANKVFIMFDDITARKRAEEALRRSEERYRETTELLSDYIFRFRVAADGKAVLESVSANFERITGRRLDAVAQPQQWLKTIHPDDVPRMAQVLQGLIRNGGTSRSEFRSTVVRDGRDVPRWVEVTARAVNDPASGRTVAIVGAVRDISERKLAEEGLRNSEQQYRATIDSMGDLIHVVDSNLRLVLANHAFGLWQQELGFKGPMLGKEVFEVFPFLPETVRGEYERVFFTGEPLLTEEITTIAGREFVTETRKIPIAENGKVVRVVTVVRDITQRRHDQERLRQAEKMEALGQLAGGIAHDFNNQLAAILGYAELLGQRADDDESKLYASTIARTVSRSADLTRQLLAFARKGKYQSMPVDIHNLIADVVALLVRTVDKRITIKQMLAANPSSTMGDSIQLQNALLNLAINARDAMPNGGDLVFATDVVLLDEEHCRAVSPKIVPGRYIEIAVSDTGVGMSEETRRRLFQPFFTTKEPGKGTGMGLAAVYGTIANHQGAISFRSELNRGTTFTLLLPLQESALPEAAPAAVESTVMGSAHILLADDEKVVREMTAAGLRHLGYRVTVCMDGTEALARYREIWREVDLVMLDMVMPKLDGRDTLLALREINPNVIALMSSGYSMDGRVQRLVDGGGVHFLQKPFHLGDLSRAVAAALRG